TLHGPGLAHGVRSEHLPDHCRGARRRRAGRVHSSNREAPMTSASRPDLAKGARLEVNDALGRRVVDINKALFEIGRRETNDLRLAGSEVSRDHADIVTEDGKIVIRDKNSRYGTYVNGE